MQSLFFAVREVFSNRWVNEKAMTTPQSAVRLTGQIVKQVQHFLEKFRQAFSKQDIFWGGY